MLVAALLGVVVVGFLFFSTDEAAIRNYPSAGTDIIAFGDSLVTGAGTTEGNNFVSRLGRELGRPIINLGNSGDTTADALLRIHELDRYNPKVVIVLLGGNDRLRNTSHTETFTNLAEIIEYIQSRGAIVLLLGVRGSVLSDPYAEYFEDLHETYQTAYVSDVLSGLFGNGEYMADTIHPNDAGHERIAKRVYPVLERLLK